MILKTRDSKNGSDTITPLFNVLALKRADLSVYTYHLTSFSGLPSSVFSTSQQSWGVVPSAFWWEPLLPF